MIKFMINLNATFILTITINFDSLICLLKCDYKLGMKYQFRAQLKPSKIPMNAFKAWEVIQVQVKSSKDKKT